MSGNCLNICSCFRGVSLLSKVGLFQKRKSNQRVSEKHMEDMRVNNDCVVRSKGHDFQTKLPPKTNGGYHL